LGGRGRRISEFEASLVYKVSSRIARAIQTNPVSKKQTKKQKNQKKNPKTKKQTNKQTNKKTQKTNCIFLEYIVLLKNILLLMLFKMII
jgi:CRISPR/Cas system CSM-associated protein Csm4 (group 5 of RAMP superfamily)